MKMIRHEDTTCASDCVYMELYGKMTMSTSIVEYRKSICAEAEIIPGMCISERLFNGDTREREFVLANDELGKAEQLTF